MPQPKPKRTKKAQPKAKVTQVESEDTLPISKLAESGKTASVPTKRSAETQPSEFTQSKKPRSSFATTSGSKIPRVPWVPEITLEDKPVLACDSADDINVGVALSTAVLLSGDLERNVKMSEYENYAFMLQRSVQDEDKDDDEALVRKPKDASETKSPSQDDQVLDLTHEEDEEVIKETTPEQVSSDVPPVDRSLDQTLAEIDAELAAEKIAEVVPPESSEDEDKDDDEALVRKPKDASETKSPPQDDQVLDLTHEEDEEVIKETTPEQASFDVPPVDRSVDQTLAEIDAELAAEKIAEVVPPESSEVPAHPAVDAEGA
ncbi:uncharacterized protein LOC114291949 [Camellia sinensis]|uniref:uncharacterized protein LOC114291949 n=1 Tax=Camellia sinensis TaxID=4442 RepID=UPI001036D235|nr:uncharacterized protein LOC114291949 [Camellia sinensis]